MAVTFVSSHTSGDFTTGRLTARITFDPPDTGTPRTVEVCFSTPPDFHTHNDSVAAALMTLVGRESRAARFNFPISRYCAENLARYYLLDDIGPVDDSMEPRRPGRRLALNFSGGIDSTLAWVLMHDVMRVEPVVITTEYEGFRFERIGYSSYRRDVSCRTNLRAVGLDRMGRFNFAVPLLYAEYADIWGIATGHTYDHVPRSLESLRDGRRPRFLDQEPSLLAGGLTEVHLLRPIFELTTGFGLVRLAPERVEAALTASGAPGTRKHATKCIVLRYAFERERLPLPPYLQTCPLPSGPPRPEAVGWRGLWMVKHLGLEFARTFDPRLWEVDVSFVDDLRLTFLERYNTNFIELVPSDLRAPLLRAFHAAGYAPYDERDFDELQVVREFQQAHGRTLETPLPVHGGEADAGDG